MLACCKSSGAEVNILGDHATRNIAVEVGHLRAVDAERNDAVVGRFGQHSGEAVAACGRNREGQHRPVARLRTMDPQLRATRPVHATTAALGIDGHSRRHDRQHRLAFDPERVPRRRLRRRGLGAHVAGQVDRRHAVRPGLLQPESLVHEPRYRARADQLLGSTASSPRRRRTCAIPLSSADSCQLSAIALSARLTAVRPCTGAGRLTIGVRDDGATGRRTPTRSRQ